MKKSSQIAGLCGLVLLLFGLAEYLFSQETSLYTTIHFIAGISMVIQYLVFNLKGVWSALGSRSTRYSANAMILSIIGLALIVYAYRRTGSFDPARYNRLK